MTATSEDLPFVGLILMGPVQDAGWTTLKSHFIADGGSSLTGVAQETERIAKPATGAYLAVARVGSRVLVMEANLGKGFDPVRADDFYRSLPQGVAVLST